MESTNAVAMPTLSAALIRYRQHVTPTKKSAVQEGNRIGQLLQHPTLPTLRLDEARGYHLAAYRDERLRAGLSANDVRLDLAIVSHLYTIARTEWSYEQLVNPVANIRKPKLPPGRDRRLASGEENRLILAAAGEMRSFIIIAIETAMRRAELAGLEFPNIDFKVRVARLPDTKNGTVRDVPLSPRALNELQWLRGRHTKGKRVFSMSLDHISHAFKDICTRAGIHGLRLHDLRHEAISRLVESGKFNLVEIAAITGHKTMQQLKRYAHPRAASLAQKMAEG